MQMQCCTTIYNNNPNNTSTSVYTIFKQYNPTKPVLGRTIYYKINSHNNNF